MTSSIRVYIGSRIKAHRKEKRVTQAGLAEAIGCEVGTIGRYERGENSPDSEQLIGMAAFFGVSPMDFLPVEVDMKRQTILDLRAELIEMVHRINDQKLLEHLIESLKTVPNPGRGTR
jgi:transcriptional regulator with XRE-family HTH domain